MSKINYSSYWYQNPLGYREIRGYQPWNTPIYYERDRRVAKYHRLFDRLAVIEDILYDRCLYDTGDCGERWYGYSPYYKDSYSETDLALLSDYEEYTHLLSTHKVDVAAILDELITSTPSY